MRLLAALLLAPQAFAQGQPPPLRFHIANMGTDAIIEVRASRVSDSSWGSNLIGRVLIPPGSTLAISTRERDTCLFDIRIVWSDGRADERRNENLCGTSRVYRVDGSAARR